MYKVISNKKSILLLSVMMLFAACAFIFSGCSNTKKDNYNGYYVYYLNANESKVDYVKYTPKAHKQSSLINEMIKMLKEKPDNISMKKVISDEVKIEEFDVGSDNELTLFFNAEYSNTTGVSEVLRRAAIVKTLTQIPGIKAVQFYVAGQPLADTNLSPVGFMSADDFIDNTGGETTYKQQASLNMYFADSTGKSLKKVAVKINYDATLSVEQMAVEQLIKGPSTINGIESKAVLPTIPDGTQVNKITVKENTCYIDFSDEFMKKRKNISSYVAIYSVVDTLVELPDINKVQFSINGSQQLFYNDTIDFGAPFERNLDLVTDN